MALRTTPHVTLRFLFLNMSTIFEKFAESLEASQKTPSSNLHLLNTFDVVKPAATTVEHTSKKEDLAVLVQWLSTAPIGLFEITDIALEEAADLQEQLRKSGHKVRYANMTVK